eukprot:8784163-Pyramimonas_sp.AAC.1
MAPSSFTYATTVQQWSPGKPSSPRSGSASRRVSGLSCNPIALGCNSVITFSRSSRQRAFCTLFC